jgi:GDP-mannose 6-dehydrogenase
MRISVFGLGYVGTVCAGCLAKEGHKVIGVDPNIIKTKLINQGKSPIIEDKIDSIIAETAKSKNLFATADYKEALKRSEISLICVGTPSNVNGSLNISYLKRVSNQIGEALRKKNKSHLIVFRSTTIPGTTENILIPIVEKASGKKQGKDFEVLYNPEFLREGSSVNDYYNPPKIIIGQSKSKKTKLTKIYQNIKAPFIITSIRTAEMAKYVDNAFHAVKVVFANEIGNICKNFGIDSHEVMNIFCMDNKLNLSSYYFKPGFAFGGSCLPKDLKALLYQAKKIDLTVPLLDSVFPSNEKQIQIAINMVQESGKKKIGLLGISFKTGTDDLRESPLVKLAETLIGKGYDLKIYDENVSLAKIFGANKDYIEKEIPHISSLLCLTLDELLSFSELLIIGNYSNNYKKCLTNFKDNKKIIDLVRCETIMKSKRWGYKGICW